MFSLFFSIILLTRIGISGIQAIAFCCALPLSVQQVTLVSVNLDKIASAASSVLSEK